MNRICKVIEYKKGELRVQLKDNTTCYMLEYETDEREHFLYGTTVTINNNQTIENRYFAIVHERDPLYGTATSVELLDVDDEKYEYYDTYIDYCRLMDKLRAMRGHKIVLRKRLKRLHTSIF